MVGGNRYVTTQNGSKYSSCDDETLAVYLKDKTTRSFQLVIRQDVSHALHLGCRSVKLCSPHVNFMIDYDQIFWCRRP